MAENTGTGGGLIRLLFPAIGRSAITEAGKFGTNSTPDVIDGGQVKKLIEDHAQLAPQATRDDVIKSAKFANKAEASAYLLAKYARNKTRALDAAVKIYQTQAEYQAAAMKREEVLQRVDSKHAKAVARYDLNIEENREGYNGYMEGFNSALNLLDGM